MQQSTLSNRKIIIPIVAAVIVIVILAIAQIAQNTNSKTSPQAKDLTGNQGIEENSIPQTWPAFSNLDNLLDHGLTLDQISGISAALKAYKPFTTSGTQVAFPLHDVQLNYPDPNDPLYRPFLLMDITVNQKTTYKLKIYYWGTSNIQLYLYDMPGNTLLYDSGTVIGKS